MKSKTIYLKDIEDVEEIVSLAEKRDYRVKVKSGNVEIDATSFMGLISQATGKEVIVQFQDTDTNLDEMLNKFAVDNLLAES